MTTTASTRACHGCGLPIVGRRPTARYCSENCRLAHWSGRYREDFTGGADVAEAEPTVVVNLRLPLDLVAAIDLDADAGGTSRSAVIRDALAEYFL